MSNQQIPTTTNVWPFAFINGERTEQSKELIASKHHLTKEVLDTNEYAEALF